MTEHEERVRDERLTALIDAVAMKACIVGERRAGSAGRREACDRLDAAKDALHEAIAEIRPVAREPLAEVVAKIARRRDRFRTKAEETEFEERYRYASMAGELDIVLDALLDVDTPEPVAATCKCGRIAGGVQVCPTCGMRGPAVPIEGALREALSEALEEAVELQEEYDRRYRDASAGLDTLKQYDEVMVRRNAAVEWFSARRDALIDRTLAALASREPVEGS